MVQNNRAPEVEEFSATVTELLLEALDGVTVGITHRQVEGGTHLVWLPIKPFLNP